MAKIKVALRVRPLSEREATGKSPVVVGINEQCAFITDIRVPERPSADSRQRLRQFNFDHAFWLTDNGNDGATQEEVYEEIGPPLEKSILAGYNACLLAYGQSGTGKTHTMLGTKGDPGLIPRLCQSLWGKLKALEQGKSSLRMEVSFIEIYREKVRDLLTPKNKSLKLREHPLLGPHVQDLTRIEVNEQLDLLNLLWEGESRRASGSTGSNRRSSRSHAIWTLYLSSTRQDSEITTKNQVHLVDLAGSEKADLITAKNLLAEGKDINRSLVSLGNVISSLAEKTQYIPYRDSALTWLLKDSLGGNAATSIIITASPASCSHAQTLNSLRFAQRARMVENQPKVNFSSPATSGMFPNMSVFDIRKDIAKLANIIRSAQANGGGILRGLMPRNAWNRLIAALESWNIQNNEMHVRHKPMRASSVDNPSTSTSTTKSLSSDAIVQANIKREDNFLSSPSVNLSPSKISGTEVFIPFSNSIKCLTWRQQEVCLLPKTPSSESESDFISPPTSPPLEMKIKHLKYLLPVHYPVSHNLDPESRISERIHGNIQSENIRPIQINPTEVVESKFFPLVRERHPTLVNPQNIQHFKELTSEKCFYKEMKSLQVPVMCKSTVERNEPTFGFGIPQASEFIKSVPVFRVPFESTDEDEETFECFPQENQCFSNFALRRHTDSTNRTSSVEEEALFFSESSITSSSSSYESIQDKYLLGNGNRVKVVQNCQFDFSEVEDQLGELENEPKAVEHHIAAVSCSDLTFATDDISLEIRNEPITPALNSISCSKFRNHFVKELQQMESIGNQIKNIRQMTKRYQVVKPYLDKIARLDSVDHTLSNAKLDAEIEACSGWDVNIEFQKVQEQLARVNDLLIHGVRSPNLNKQMHISSFSGRNSNSESILSSSNGSSCSHSKQGATTISSRRTSNVSSSQPVSETYCYNYTGRLPVKNECFTPLAGSPIYSGSRTVSSMPQSNPHYAQKCVDDHFGHLQLQEAENYLATKRGPILPKTHHYLQNGRIRMQGPPQPLFNNTHKVNSNFSRQEQLEEPRFSQKPFISKNRVNSTVDRSMENRLNCERDIYHKYY